MNRKYMPLSVNITHINMPKYWDSPVGEMKKISMKYGLVAWRKAGGMSTLKLMCKLDYKISIIDNLLSNERSFLML